MLVGRNLAITPAPTNLGRGIQKDLYLRVGKDRRANVTTFHHHAACFSQSTLLGDHPLPNPRMNGNARCSRGYVPVADAAGDVHAVKQNAVSVARWLEFDRRIATQIQHLRLCVQVEISVNGLVGQSAIHRTGFEVQEAELTSQMRGQRALARARRPVNGNDRPLTRDCGLYLGS